MNKFRNIVVLLLAVLFSGVANAQETVADTNTDLMHRDGRIYVVVAVVLAIVIGLFIYVYSLDRKISKLERS